MSWISAYRLSLHLLPAELRRKHGLAMEALFARELDRARARGRLHVALVGVSCLCDLVRRGTYEHLRAEREVTSEQPTTRQLLGRHAASFATAFVLLTVSLLARFATRELAVLSARGASASANADALLLAVPFIAALTIPMSVLIAVLWEFTRLGKNGTLAAARRERHGVRRLVVPVLAAAVGVSALAFVVTAEIVPRANARLMVLEQGPSAASDRAMTISELREASRKVRPGTDQLALERVVRYEVEIQKKLALPAGCVILALVAMALAFSVPRGGAALVIGASLVVFGAYYVLLITGESLANRLVISPFVGMWGANALLLAVTMLAEWRVRQAPRATTPPRASPPS